MNIEYETSDLKEPLSLWSIPFTLLLIMLILAAADVLFSFIPLEISHGTWMWAFSTVITTVCASLVAEKLSMDNRRAVISMAGAAAFSILFYRGISSFLQRSVVSSIQSIIPNPFVEMVVYTSVLTIIPGALVGVIFGGVLGFLPNRTSPKRKISFEILPEEPKPQGQGVGKICSRCEQGIPIDSSFCPFCGAQPEQRSAPQMMYCRFCGSPLKYQGQFCPECGREIDMISKPLVFYSV
jgi:RNA polymerase subunit RPABC4/transcription elongation factor Spt4